MQVQTFESGAFVVHKAQVGSSTMKFSAWFNAEGELMDVEGFDSLGRSRSIKRGGPVWRDLQEMGGYRSVSRSSKQMEG